MSILITETRDRVKLGENDHRSFAEGERHTLLPEHEERLIGLGIAERAEEKAMDPVSENKAIEPAIENKAAQPVKAKKTR